MNNTKNTKKLGFVFFTTILFWLVAHGYRFMNNLHTCDSLVCVLQDDVEWQRSLGRFMQPFALLIRGTITSPWLIFTISVVVFSLAIWLISQILDIRNNWVTAGIVGVLVCNVALTSSIAAFLHSVDIFCVALLFSVFGVWMYRKDTLLGYMVGSLSFVLSLGTYQAYIDVALVLIFIAFIFELSDKDSDIRKVMVKLVKTVIGLGVSGAVYYVVFKLVCLIHHVTVTDSYNGLKKLGDYSDTGFFKVILDSYAEVFKTLFSGREKFVSTYLKGEPFSEVWVFVIRICVGLSIAGIIGGLIYLNIKNKTKTGKIVIQFIALVLMPFAINFVYIMSIGTEHSLMIFSFFFIFVFALAILDRAGIFEMKNTWVRALCVLPIVLIIWNNIVYSNQIYFKLDMQDRAALSYVTRLMDDIENTEGYIPGQTKVIFLGTAEKAAPSVAGFQDVTVYGMQKTPFNFGTASMRIYINTYLGSNMIIADGYTYPDEVNFLSPYPNKNAFCVVGDTIYVKLSE